MKDERLAVPCLILLLIGLYHAPRTLLILFLPVVTSCVAIHMSYNININHTIVY